MYVELHARSAFSFLQGASLPEEMVQVCADQGMGALALVDRDGFYGSPRFHQAAKKQGVKAHIGAEVSVEGAGRWPLLVRDRQGYRNLCRLITRYKLRSKKGEGAATVDEMAGHAGGLVCLTGGEDGPLALALARDGSDGARRRPSASSRSSAPRTSTPRCSATTTPWRRRATRRWPRSRVLSACPSSLPTASPTPRPPSARCSTCSRACATTRR
jgi:error-prone DNA polymerase